MTDRKYKFSRKTRQRMSKAHTGKKHTPETIAKIKTARRERDELIAMGLLQPFRHTDETKRKLSRLAKKRRQKPPKLALKNSIKERQNKAADRKLKRKIERGQL